jgi:hypothetical protein
MSPEEAAQTLLQQAFVAERADIFADASDPDAAKAGADLLVTARFAEFADTGRTQIVLTNAGRYWALHGGYFAFLKETPPGAGLVGGSGRGRNPELEETRLTLMRLRLGTFWWSFGLSIVGFVISVVSLIVALTFGGRLLGP